MKTRREYYKNKKIYNLLRLWVSWCY